MGRGVAWAVAAFIVLTVGGMYLAFGGEDGRVVDQPTVPTPTTVLTPAPNPTRLPEVGQEPVGPLAPGAYVVVDRDPSTRTRGTFLIEGPGWMGSDEGISRQNGVSLHLHQVDEPVPPGCEWAVNPMPAGSTAADLADGFAVSGFTVRDAPAPVSAFGHDGYHVVVEVPGGCNGGGYGSGHTNILLHPGDVVEAWIFDIDGHIVVDRGIVADKVPGGGPGRTKGRDRHPGARG